MRYKEKLAFIGSATDRLMHTLCHTVVSTGASAPDAAVTRFTRA